MFVKDIYIYIYIYKLIIPVEKKTIIHNIITRLFFLNYLIHILNT